MRPVRSGALSLAARELARLAAAGVPSPLARRRVREAAWRAGAADPGPAAHLVAGPPQRIAEAIPALLVPGTATHLGVGAAERDGLVYLVLLTSERLVRLERFAAAAPPGARLALAGALLAPLSGPRVVITRPSGEVEELAATGGRAFRVGVPLDAPGRHLVEVMASGPRGPEVAALLAVEVGDPPADPAAGAAEPPGAASRHDEPGGDESDPELVEARVLEAVNRLRRRHRLGPVAADPELTAVARRHSADMLAHRVLAHVLPGGGDLGERLRAARIPYRHAVENVAKGRSGLEAHEAAEESPAHRGNLLSPEVTRAGVGLARGTLPGGDPVAYLTEILVEPGGPEVGARRSPEEQVRVALWAERERLGLPPLTADPRLDELARGAAAALRRDGELSPERLADQALALGRGLAAADAFVVSAPAEAARSRHLAEGRHARVGVGVAQGDSPRWGAGRLFIAVIYSDAPPDR